VLGTSRRDDTRIEKLEKEERAAKEEGRKKAKEELSLTEKVSLRSTPKRITWPSRKLLRLLTEKENSKRIPLNEDGTKEGLLKKKEE